MTASAVDDRTTATDAPGTDGERPAGRPARPAGRLLELGVTDLALIDRLRLTLDDGFIVLTGETGAGKSLLIDALGLVLGARADTTLVRHGAATARVDALFDRMPEPLIALREVSATGRSTARLDDEPVTASRLGEVTTALVEIHGQNDQQRLLDERWQRDVLDAFGGHDELRHAVASAVARWQANRDALEALVVEPRELVRRVELLEHELAEIQAARLRAGEADAITARLAAAQHAETIVRGAAAVRGGLGDEGRGARDVVARAEAEARTLARYDPRWDGLADRLAGAAAELDDIAAEARTLGETMDHDPAELAALSDRLGEIHRLLRRYGDDEAAVLAHAETIGAELARLRGLDEERARRETDDAVLLVEIATYAAELSARRGITAAAFGLAVDAVLRELGFPAGSFEVAVGRRPAGRDEPAIEVDGDALAFDGTGIDTVVFRFRPNAGEPGRPLARIASGGELSRVALAIKEVLATVDRTPTLVFDEIDAGIGGRSADPVGRSLWALARTHQVLCVTHLPQIAAYADAHHRIAKRQRDGRTVTEVEQLDREGRVAELAAMIGGAAGGPAAAASARELLDRAEAWRAQRAAGA